MVLQKLAAAIQPGDRISVRSAGQYSLLLVTEVSPRGSRIDITVASTWPTGGPTETFAARELIATA
jgi:hypothetical protein